MRVLHIDSGRDMRGGQLQVLKLLTGLDAECVLLTPAAGPLMEAAHARGINAQPLNIRSIATVSRRFDLTHAHDARSHTWAAALTQTPLVVARRVAFPIGQSVLSRWKYNRAHRYVAVSQHVKRTLIHGEVPEERISVVYDGVDLPDRTASGDRILALATSDPMKGSDLLDAAAELAGLRVHYSANLQRDLPGAAVFVYITRSEGLGSAALIAMAHGVPVVASRVGGLPEIVADQMSGILTENAPEEIADAILRALANREFLGQNARRCVEERFCTKHMVENTREVYRRVLA